jgi:antitoxin component YwqK of YwqJK toxin-antitoxin module
MKRILLIVFILHTTLSHAQVAIPFGFTSEEKNKLIRENDSVKFYTATRDTSRIVSINDETNWYRLLNKKDRSVIAEGSFIVDDEKYMQEGRAVAHYPDGGIKLAGFYRHGKPVGLWQAYYPGGQLKNIYNYAIILDDGGFSSCYSGSYQEFFENGKLKVNGFYAAKMTEVFDTVDVEDPVTNEYVHKAISRMSYAPQKTGHWEYYNESGELDKKEDF